MIPTMAITLKQIEYEEDIITIGFMPQYKSGTGTRVQELGET